MEAVEKFNSWAAEIVIGDGGLSGDPRHFEEGTDDWPNVHRRRRPLLRLEVGFWIVIQWKS